VETHAARRWPGPVVRVDAGGFPRGLAPGSLAAALRMMRAFVICRRRMSVSRPAVLLAMGCYASVAPALAARSLGLPVVLHEANALPGRAILLLARFAAAVAVSFEETRRHLRHRRIVLTGLPLARDFAAPRPSRARGDRLTLLVTGGSQGAAFLNDTALAAVLALHAEGLPLDVIHAAGEQDAERVRSRYAQAGVTAEVSAFIEDMREAYDAADFALTRAGAGTCAELVARGVPALLVPLPSAAGGHQAANAGALAGAGGVAVVAQDDLTVDRLSTHLREFFRNPQRLASMERSQRETASPRAAEQLAKLVETVAAGSARPGGECNADL
jgi:UDP-N-acetylglucosamine--N-acetylmuramyl-(pentapeptide) pyrophosphoryl-undecaprenol N-acetylglucosamine transferase